MKTLPKISAAIILFSALNIFQASAQTNAEEANNSNQRTGIILSVGPDVGFPVGSLNDRFGSTVGGAVKADFPVWNNQLYVTTTAGFNNFFVKDGYQGNQNDLQLLPVKAGLKYYPIKNFYIEGEAGTSFILNKNQSGFDKTASFTYAPLPVINLPYQKVIILTPA
jgi:hypothetical protein